MALAKNTAREIAKDIVEYIDLKHAVDVDRFDIQEIIYIGLRDYVEVVEEGVFELPEDIDE